MIFCQNKTAKILLFADDITLTQHKDKYALRREMSTELTHLETWIDSSCPHAEGLLKKKYPTLPFWYL